MQRLNKISFPSDLAFVFGNQNALQAPVDSTLQVRVGHGKPLPRHFTVDNVVADSWDHSKCCLPLWLLLSMLMLLGIGSTSFSLPATPPLLLAGIYKPSPGQLRDKGGMLRRRRKIKGGLGLLQQASLPAGEEQAGWVGRASELCPSSRRGWPREAAMLLQSCCSCLSPWVPEWTEEAWALLLRYCWADIARDRGTICISAYRSITCVSFLILRVQYKTMACNFIYYSSSNLLLSIFWDTPSNITPNITPTEIMLVKEPAV